MIKGRQFVSLIGGFHAKKQVYFLFLTCLLGNRVGSQSDMVSTAQRLHAGAASLACGPSGVVLEGLGWAVRPDLFAPVRRASPTPRSSRDRTFRGCLPRRRRRDGRVVVVARAVSLRA